MFSSTDDKDSVYAWECAGRANELELVRERVQE
jgi:hypothetical protein